MIVLALLLFFLFTSGTIYFLPEYIFAWENIFTTLIYKNSKWVFIGTQTQYKKHLERMDEELKERKREREN